MFIIEVFVEWILTGVVYKAFARFAAKQRLHRYMDGTAVAVPGRVEGGDVVLRHGGFLIAEGGELVSSTEASGFSKVRVPLPDSGTVKVTNSAIGSPWQEVPQVVYASGGSTTAVYFRPQDLPLMLAVLRPEHGSSS